MREAHVRREIYGLLRRLHYTPHRLRDAYSSVDKRAAGLAKSLFRYVRAPKARGVLAALVKMIEASLQLPPSGRPDILVNSAYGPGTYVEVKVLNYKVRKSFPFDAITSEQNRYMAHRMKAGFTCYLALGTVNVPKEVHDSRFKRRLWIPDWDNWTAVVQLVSEHQGSIPEIAGKGFSRALQDMNLDLSHLLHSSECIWSKGLWHLPTLHSLWQDKAPPGELEL